MRYLIIILLAFFIIQSSAQDLIIPKKGNPITAYNIDVSSKYIFYQSEASEKSPILRIAIDDVLMVRKDDGTVLEMKDRSNDVKENTEMQNNNGIPANTSSFPVIREVDIHGNLIAKGNCVYVPTDSPYDYERAGQEKLKEIMKEWNYWTVVDKPSQAHFILQFTTQTKGKDISFIIVRPRKYYASHPLLIYKWSTGKWTNASNSVGITMNWAHSNEDVSDNIRIASLMALHLKDMILYPNRYDSRTLFGKKGNAFDADNNNNDCRSCIEVKI